MKKRIYEWRAIQDEDVHHADTLANLLKLAPKPADLELTLHIYNRSTDDYDIGYAEVKQRGRLGRLQLPCCFDVGIEVPQKFRKELAASTRAQDSVVQYYLSL
tara:strand:+ start:498 stop:806 length:309 start_codon:yes stop_codon:yes gene_type:complete